VLVAWGMDLELREVFGRVRAEPAGIADEESDAAAD
jgi:hypothetical protein